MRNRVFKTSAFFLVFLAAGAFALTPFKDQIPEWEKVMFQNFEEGDLIANTPLPKTDVNAPFFTLLVISVIIICGLLTSSLFHCSLSAKSLLSNFFLMQILFFMLIHVYWLHTSDAETVAFCAQSTHALKILILGSFLHLLLVSPAPGRVSNPVKFLAALAYIPGLFIAFTPSEAYIARSTAPGTPLGMYTGGPLFPVFPLSHLALLGAGLLLVGVRITFTRGDARNRMVFSGVGFLFALVGALTIRMDFFNVLDAAAFTDVICLCFFSLFVAYAASPPPLYDYSLLFPSFFNSRKHRFLRDMEKLAENMKHHRSPTRIAKALSGLFGRDVAIDMDGKAAGGDAAFKEAAPPAGAVQAPPENVLIFPADLGPEFNGLKSGLKSGLKEAGVGGLVIIPLSSEGRAVVKLGPGVDETVYSSQDMKGLEAVWAAAAARLGEIRRQEIEDGNRRLCTMKDAELARTTHELDKKTGELEEFQQSANEIIAGKNWELGESREKMAARLEAAGKERALALASLASERDKADAVKNARIREMEREIENRDAMILEFKNEKKRREEEDRAKLIEFSPPLPVSFASAAGGDDQIFKTLFVGKTRSGPFPDAAVESFPSKTLEDARALMDKHAFGAMILHEKIFQNDRMAPVHFRNPVIVATRARDIRKKAKKLFPESIIRFIMPSHFKRMEIIRKILLETLAVERATLFRLGGERLISTDPNVMGIASKLREIAGDAQRILITGASGVGKELFANLIHKSRPDCDAAPFINVNCNAIADNLFESEFFGHVKGSFTGAIKSKKGIFESAHKGTLVLDEIGELSVPNQIKLLRALENKETRKVGSQELNYYNALIIFLTNSNLMDRANIRGDFFNRIARVQIPIPGLKDRVREDIELLSMFFLWHYNAVYGVNCKISEDLISKFKAHSLPGNARELGRLIEGAVALGGENGILTKFPPPVEGGKRKTLIEKRDDLFIESITNALIENDGSQVKAAESLGLKESTFRVKRKRYKISLRPWQG